MSGEGFEFLLLRDDNRSLRERLKAAEKVIEAARLLLESPPALKLSVTKLECPSHGLCIPCAQCALADAITDYYEQTAR